jgi:MFS family permease
MQHPVEFATALITVSVAFMAIAGIFIGIIGTRDKTQLRKRDRWVVLFNAISVILGILVMVFVMKWFEKQYDGDMVIARYLLVFQFAGVYVPLSWYVRDNFSALFKKKTKNSGK